MLGFDTGFFVRLLAGDPEAVAVWRTVGEDEASGVVSCLTLYELRRLGLRGAIPAAAADTLLAELGHACEVVWLTEPGVLDQAARVAHGNGLSTADALILVSLAAAGAGIDVPRVRATAIATLDRRDFGPLDLRASPRLFPRDR